MACCIKVALYAVEGLDVVSLCLSHPTLFIIPMSRTISVKAGFAHSLG